MTNPGEFVFATQVAQILSDGSARYGDVGVKGEAIESHLRSLVAARQAASDCDVEIASFLRALHTGDLYLAIACAEQIECAWRCFVSAYRKYMHDVARFFCGASGADDLAESLPGHIFLPGRSGKCRIGSYDGRTSLATWLRVIIKRRASDERTLRANNNESLEAANDTPSVSDLDREVCANRYNAMAADSLKLAIEKLGDDERRLLALKYIETLKGPRIAELLGMEPSTVTRQISGLRMKLRDEVISILSAKYSLPDAAITECVRDLVENPAHSIFALLE
jgi:RNA polymerase sigma-70 factor